MACRLDGAKLLSDQCWNIVNWTLRNKIQWNFNRNSYIFIQENALENVVCEVASFLSRPQCVKLLAHCCTSCTSWKKMRYAYIRHRVHKFLTLYISVIQWWNCHYSIVKINNSFWDPITGLIFQKKYDFLIDKRWQKPLDTQSCCSLYMTPQCYVTSQ